MSMYMFIVHCKLCDFILSISFTYFIKIVLFDQYSSDSSCGVSCTVSSSAMVYFVRLGFPGILLLALVSALCRSSPYRNTVEGCNRRG